MNKDQARALATKVNAARQHIKNAYEVINYADTALADLTELLCEVSIEDNGGHQPEHSAALPTGLATLLQQLPQDDPRIPIMVRAMVEAAIQAGNLPPQA